MTARLSGSPSPVAISGRRMATIGDGTLALADWIRQADRDTYGRSMEELIHTYGYGDLFWAMRELGEEVRRNVGRELYRRYADTQGVVPDPRGPLPFSNQAIIIQTCHEYGVEPLRMTPDLRRLAEDYGVADGGRVIYAWLQFAGADPSCAPTDRPTLVADPESPRGEPQSVHEDRWTWQAAQVLGVYLYHHRMYSGSMLPPETILPPNPFREKSMTPLAHQFAKALLNWEERCPEGAPCYCNYILNAAHVVPQKHQQATGELDRRALARAYDRDRSHTPHTPAHTPNTPRATTRPNLGGGDAPHITPLEWRERHPSQPSQPSGPIPPLGPNSHYDLNTPRPQNHAHDESDDESGQN